MPYFVHRDKSCSNLHRYWMMSQKVLSAYVQLCIISPMAGALVLELNTMNQTEGLPQHFDVNFDCLCAYTHIVNLKPHQNPWILCGRHWGDMFPARNRRTNVLLLLGVRPTGADTWGKVCLRLRPRLRVARKFGRLQVSLNINSNYNL
jgi:hypothetical protein